MRLVVVRPRVLLLHTYLAFAAELLCVALHVCQQGLNGQQPTEPLKKGDLALSWQQTHTSSY
jgi:hypothetical protein